MKTTNLLKIAFCFVVVGLLGIVPAYAGFGVSTADIINENLLPGSQFEKSVTLNRTAPEKTAQITTEIEGDEIKNWISLDPGFNFNMAIGVEKMPVAVHINVPRDAQLGEYIGKIKFTETVGVEESTVGTGAAMMLGAAVNVKLTVTDKKVRKFSIVSWENLKMEENNPIAFSLGVRNDGNVVGALSRIVLEASSMNNEPLETHEITKLDKIQPFSTQKSIVRAPGVTKLTEGTYWLNIKIYDGETVMFQDKALLNIFKIGALKKGSIKFLNIDKNVIKAGESVSIMSDFINEGQVPASAKLRLNIYDSKAVLIKTIETDAVDVLPGKTNKFAVSFEAQQTGKYTIKGVIEYDGLLTAEKELSLYVGYAMMTKIMFVIAGIIGLIVLVLLVIWIVKKFRK
ncbi:hypothetical protein KKC32_04740 [Patescibacteria group bacterium]|nr:hypothetical protein [Patescibacteria group bacterium]